MAIGQQVLSGVASLELLRAAEDAVEATLVPEGRVHVDRLRAVLALQRKYAADGLAVSATPTAARLLRCSEWRADRLLDEAMLLTTLPEALDSIMSGVLTVEQSSIVVTQLRQVVDLESRLVLWRRLVERLRRPDGAVLPPARLQELLKGWIVRSDPADAERRRRAAEDERRVEYRRRDDGLVDVLLLGVAPPLAQSVLQRIRAQAEPVGLFDDRTADQRRLDAAVDLLLGREISCGSSCDCRPGTPVPCGADVKLLVPLGAALGTTDEVATLAGHGPIEPALLRALLLNSPRLRPVFVDESGVPVTLGPRRRMPERNDPQALREALLGLATSPPGRVHPRHPDDHPPAPLPDSGLPDPRPAGADAGADPPPDPAPGPSAASSHPPDSAGPYAVTGLLRELVFTRAPLCEFPACGAGAESCDAEHDRAHPDGPTCACNLGPLCRRHHRVKQQGWTKSRLPDSAVRWTSPTGRTWLSPSQHRPPAPAVRPLAPMPVPLPLDELSPTFADDELWELLGRPDDPVAYELRAVDREPERVDDLAEQLDAGATAWTLDLDDPYAWTGPAFLD